MRARPLFLLPLTAACVLLLLCACGDTTGGGRPAGSDTAKGPEPGGAPGQAGSLPRPAQLDALRAGSELLETLIGGKFTLSRSAGAQEQGSALLLDASAAGPGLGAVSEWALYGFDSAAAGGSLDSLQVLLDADAAGAWVGLSDFSSGRWEWHGPYSSFKTLLVDDPKYVSPGGTLFVSVVSPAGINATVNALSVRTINPNNAAPSADLQADVSSGNAPLTVSFDASASSDPEGQALVYLWDWEGDGLVDASSISAQVSHVYASGGSFMATLRVEDSSAAAASASVQIEVNSPPQAVIGVASGELLKGEQIHLSAQGSSDLDGSISNYEWDTDGNGSFESSSGPSPELTFTGQLAGPQNLSLRVTDNDGATDIASVPVWVSGFNLGQPDGALDSGGVSAIAVVNGELAVCFKDLANERLMYARCLNQSGTLWSDPVVIQENEQGTFFNLLEVDGRPAVAWQNFPGTNLCYVRALAEDGSAWGSVQVLDNSGFTAYYTDMDLVGGIPSIAYFDPGNNKLRYQRAADPDGFLWSGPITVENTTGARDCSLEEINGKPALAYCLTTTLDLMYEQAADSEGLDWTAASIPVDSVNVTGLSCNLIEVPGGPAIAYHDADQNKLLYKRSMDANGNAWQGAQILSATPGSGQTLSMRMNNGRPLVVYTANNGPGTFQLYSLQALDSSGISWDQPSFALSSVSLINPDLAVYQGRAAVSVDNTDELACLLEF